MVSQRGQPVLDPEGAAKIRASELEAARQAYDHAREVYRGTHEGVTVTCVVVSAAARSALRVSCGLALLALRRQTHTRVSTGSPPAVWASQGERLRCERVWCERQDLKTEGGENGVRMGVDRLGPAFHDHERRHFSRKGVDETDPEIGQAQPVDGGFRWRTDDSNCTLRACRTRAGRVTLPANRQLTAVVRELYNGAARSSTQQSRLFAANGEPPRGIRASSFVTS